MNIVLLSSLLPTKQKLLEANTLHNNKTASLALIIESRANIFARIPFMNMWIDLLIFNT